MLVRMRTFLVVVAGLAATGLVVERAAADGRHGYVFGGWTGTISYQYTRSEEQLADPLHEYRRHVAVVGTLKIPVAADPTFTVGWDEVSEARSFAFCIPPTSAELITTGTTINRTTGKGGRTGGDGVQRGVELDHDSPSTSRPPTSPTRRRPRSRSVRTYQPRSQTWAATSLGGEVFTAPTRLEDPGVPKLLGTIERATTDANGSIREAWKVGYDLQACGEYAGPRWTRHFPADNRIEALKEPVPLQRRTLRPGAAGGGGAGDDHERLPAPATGVPHALRLAGRVRPQQRERPLQPPRAAGGAEVRRLREGADLLARPGARREVQPQALDHAQPGS